MTADCPDPSLLALFVECGLHEDERVEIQQHCEACTECREVVETALDFAATQDQQSPVPLPNKGETIGRFVVLDTVGAGAMGVVFSAFDPELDRKVAIKVLPCSSGGSPGRRHARFLVEARAMAGLSHPNVIGVYELGMDRGHAFFAMELIRGQNLKEWLVAAPRSFADIISVFAAAGRGLAAAHTAGVVHRDFKPANVLVGEDGRVKIIDFGLARIDGEPTLEGASVVASRPVAQLRTQRGAVIGTLAYMAPEQLRGHRIDASADQFAYCVALYEALFGRRPFVGQTVAELAEAIGRGLPANPDTRHHIPRAIIGLLRVGLRSRCSARHRNMDEVVAGLTAHSWTRRAPLAAGFVAMAGMSVAYGAAASDTPSCVAKATDLDVWNGERRAEILDLGASGGEELDERGRWLVERLDGYADRWTEHYAHSCEATVERHEATAETMERRMACLHRARQQFASHLAQITDSDGAALVHAGQLVESLDPLQPCASSFALPDAPPASIRPQVQRVRGQLARARSLIVTADFGAAVDASAEAFASAQALGYQPLVAHAAHRLANAAFDVEDFERALAMDAEAFRIATAIDNDSLAAKSAAGLACTHAEFGPSGGASVAWGEVATAIAVRVEVGSDELAAAHRCLGLALARGGEVERGVEQLRRAVDYERDSPEFAEIAEARTRLALLMPLVQTGELLEARQHADEAVALLESAAGRASPLVIRANAARATVMVQQDDTAAAERAFRELIPVWRELVGPQSLDIATSHANLGDLLYRDDRFDEAIAEFKEAKRIFSDGLPPHHFRVLLMSDMIALSQLHGGLAGIAAEPLEDAVHVALAHAEIGTPIRIRLQRTQAAVGVANGDFTVALKASRGGLSECAARGDADARVCAQLALAAGESLVVSGDGAAASQMLAKARAWFGEPTTMSARDANALQRLTAKIREPQ